MHHQFFFKIPLKLSICKLNLFRVVGTCLIIISMIIFQRLSRLFIFGIASDSDVSDFRFPIQIDYKISMQRISQYRMSTYTNKTKYRWLFLTNFGTYHVMMHRHYFAQYYAAKRHPNIDPTLWGSGFPGYNASMTIVENIRNRFGSFDYFDVIYQSGGVYSKTDVRLASRYSPIMTLEHECWGYLCLPSIIDDNVTIVLQAYAYEMDLYHTSFSYNRVLGHSPICAEPLVFYPPVVLNSDKPPVRDIDFLIVGARHSFVYPLRTRLGEMVKKGLIKNSYLHVHPGYTFGNNTVEQTESHMHAYATLLRRAKIVLVDSSRYHYALNKYSEVALSGCLIVGDIPAEREEEFRHYVVEISMNMTDDQILSVVDYWIKHDHEREKKIALGQQIVLNSYTWDHSIDLSLQALLKYRRGEFGIYHNYPYSSRCVPFDNTLKDQPTATKWCTSGIRGIPLRSLCECNRTHINYMEEEPDLDNWRGLGLDIDSNNPRMYLVPTSFLRFCDLYERIQGFVYQAPSGSLCRCQHADGPWRSSDICYVVNTALIISRHLAYLHAHNKKISQN